MGFEGHVDGRNIMWDTASSRHHGRWAWAVAGIARVTTTTPGCFFFGPPLQETECRENSDCNTSQVCLDQACVDVCRRMADCSGDGVVCDYDREVCLERTVAQADGVPHCGDGVVQEGGEECDDGNVIDDDYCANNCAHVGECGDRVVQSNELCDDGNGNSDAWAPAIALRL